LASVPHIKAPYERSSQREGLQEKRQRNHQKTTTRIAHVTAQAVDTTSAHQCRHHQIGRPPRADEEPITKTQAAQHQLHRQRTFPGNPPSRDIQQKPRNQAASAQQGTHANRVARQRIAFVDE
jgi:hypothetical protein